MTTIQVKMTKEQFVQKMTDDLEEKKRREQEAKKAVYEYIKDRVTKNQRRRIQLHQRKMK